MLFLFKILTRKGRQITEIIKYRLKRNGKGSISFRTSLTTEGAKAQIIVATNNIP